MLLYTKCGTLSYRTQLTAPKNYSKTVSQDLFPTHTGGTLTGAPSIETTCDHIRGIQFIPSSFISFYESNS